MFNIGDKVMIIEGDVTPTYHNIPLDKTVAYTVASNAEYQLAHGYMINDLIETIIYYNGGVHAWYSRFFTLASNIKKDVDFFSITRGICGG